MAKRREVTNDERAAHAEIALRQHALIHRVDGPELDKFGSVVDLMTNIRHWAKANGVSFQDAIRISQQHYDEEHAHSD